MQYMYAVCFLSVKASTLLENIVHCIVDFESQLPLTMHPDFIAEPFVE